MLVDTGRLDQGPLCPQDFPPIHPAHALHRRVNDAGYNAAPRTEGDDLELTPDAEKVHSAVTDGQFSSYMLLYRHDERYLQGRQFVVVSAHWYRCGVCGFVLPAHGEVERIGGQR